MPALPAGAACYGHDPALWFPHTFGPSTNSDTARALAICNSCPIRAECLDFALTLVPQAMGIWGGRWLRSTEHRGVTPAELADIQRMAREGHNAATIARTLALPFRRVEIALRPHDGP